MALDAKSSGEAPNLSDRADSNSLSGIDSGRLHAVGESDPQSGQEQTDTVDRAQSQSTNSPTLVIWNMINSPAKPLLRVAMSRPILSGGLLGAFIALSITYLATQFFSKADPKVAEVAAVTSTLLGQVSKNARKLTGIEADVAQSILLATENASTIAGYDARLNQIALTVSSTEQKITNQQSVGSPVFGVAAGQLLAKVATGDSFAPEWVNIYALAETSPELQRELEKLMPLAQTGVRTLPQLQVALEEFKENVFFPDSRFGRFWVETLSTIQYKLGLPIARSTSEEIVLQHIEQAILLLSAGDVTKAEYVVSTLPSLYTNELSTWLEAARRHQIALDGARTISIAAEQALRQRLQ